MKIKKFHIYLADLNPKYGTESGKTRPVVVVQTDMLNRIHPSTIVLPVTSKIFKNVSLLRVHIPKKESKLDKDSDILIDLIRSIDTRRIKKHIGDLKEETKQKILKNLEVLLLE